MAISSPHCISPSLFPSSPKIEARAGSPGCLIFAARRKYLNCGNHLETAGATDGYGAGGNWSKVPKTRHHIRSIPLACQAIQNGQRKMPKLGYAMDRIPFLEEQVRKVKDSGKLLTMDIERLLLWEDNRFDFVNEVAAEAKSYVENNQDAYGAKKAILHVLSNL